MSERALQDHVIDAATKLGFLVYHTWNSQHSAAGFPDLVMVRGSRQIVAELKRQDKSPSFQQILWLRAFEAAGSEAYLWRPSDWSSGEITAALSGERRTA